MQVIMFGKNFMVLEGVWNKVAHELADTVNVGAHKVVESLLLCFVGCNAPNFVNALVKRVCCCGLVME